VCGIIGYIGGQKALPFLLSGLKDLEYRGYDSCGIALIEKGKLKVIKTKGEVDFLVKKTRGMSLRATVGIGHTRWATHGKPSRVNAHPHLDCTQKVAVIHNGIIENFQELKKSLIQKGHQFTSQTDTEILPHLIEENLKKRTDLFWAVCQSLKKVIGAYGLAVLAQDFPDEIIAARISSPLILGFGRKENYLASDQPALVNWTQKLATLKDGQIAKISADKVQIKTINGQSANYQKIFLEPESRQVGKAGYPHFMLKEIFEQPKVLENGLKGRFDLKKGVKLGGIEGHLDRFDGLVYLPMVACGSSFHAALVSKNYFQKLANLPVLVENATELISQKFPWKQNQPVIFISQSGETADVLRVLKKAKKQGVFPLGMVNIAGSSLSRQTKAGVYLRAGYEVGVAATKTFTAQILTFLLWSLLIAEKRALKSGVKNKLFKEIKDLPGLASQVLAKKAEIKKTAKQLLKAKKIYLLGRGASYALSLEAALKIKEVAYLPAEGLMAGELKHGPLALVDKKTVLLFLIPDDEFLGKNLNAVAEASAREAKILVLTNKKSLIWQKQEIRTCFLPHSQPLLSVFPMTIWLQLLAYYLADFLGRSIDKPRHLAKSVTVE